jgi:oligogalacturonide transport system substrate-binding protein
MKKALVLILVLGMAIAGTLTAGGKSEGPAAAAKKEIKLRFSWWGGEARHKATLRNIENYMKLNPHVTIEPEYGAFGGYLEKLYVQLSSKSAPDIPQVDFKWVFDLIRDNKSNFKNIKDYADKIDLGSFDRKLIETVCGTPDYYIGVPLGTNTFGMIYSVPFFKKFGLSDPGKWSWDDIIEMGRKVQAQDKKSYLFYNIANNYGYMFKYLIKQRTGKDMISDSFSLTCTREDAEAVFSYYLKLVDTGTIPPLEETMPYATSYPDQVPKWISGQYGMHLSMPSNLSSIVAGSPFETSTLYLPVIKNARSLGWPTTASMIYTLYAHGANIDEAARFINYLVNDAGAYTITGDTRGIPANAKAAKLLADKGAIMPQMLGMIQKSADLGTTAENGPTLDQKLMDLTIEFAQQVGFRKMTPDKAAEAYMAEVNKMLAGKKK